MTWFAFQGLNGGKAIDLAGSQEKQAVVVGFHGYATEAQAEKQPNAVNFLTRVQADAFIADYKAAVDQQSQPGGKNANILNPVTAAKAGVTGDVKLAKNAAGSLTGLNAIGDFFNRLTDASTWVRVAKVLVGGMLLIVGLAHMTGVSGAAADAARRAPLPV